MSQYNKLDQAIVIESERIAVLRRKFGGEKTFLEEGVLLVVSFEEICNPAELVFPKTGECPCSEKPPEHQ